MEIHVAAKTQGLLMCYKLQMCLRIVQLRCIYTNAHSMSNKREELEAIVQQENYDIVAITDT